MIFDIIIFYTSICFPYFEFKFTLKTILQFAFEKDPKRKVNGYSFP